MADRSSADGGPDRIRRALDYIAQGRVVTLRLKDGREIEGRLGGLDARGRIQIDDEIGSQSVSLMLVVEVRAHPREPVPEDGDGSMQAD